MVSISDSIKRNSDEEKLTLTIVVGFSLALFISNYFRHYKDFSILILIILLLLCMYLDMQFVLNIEGSKIKRKAIRIDEDEFKINPNKEISRYVEAVEFYRVSWRTSISISIMIVLFIYPFISSIYKPYPIHLTILVFFIVYHYSTWRDHHSTRFLHKTVIDANNYIHKNDRTIPFKQLLYN
jgi:uncharacterized membrane protein